MSNTGKWAVVGAPWDSPGGEAYAGSVYVYQRSGESWVFSQKLTAASPATGDTFGFSVSIAAALKGSPERLVVGAPRWNQPTGSGSVHTFELDPSFSPTWVPTGSVTSAGVGDEFGYSVCVNTHGAFAVGAPKDSSEAAGAGAVHLYSSGSIGAIHNKYTASDASENDEFGTAVSYSYTGLLVGSPGVDAPAFRDDTGAVYYFGCDSQMLVCYEIQKIFAGEASPGSFFGSSVAHTHRLVGGKLIVGAPEDNVVDLAGRAGSAYVFTMVDPNWIQEARLLATDPDDLELFGHSVAISEHRAVVGSVFDSTADFHAGAAYTYNNTGSGWVNEDLITATDAAGGDVFGASVSLVGDMLMVGAPQEDPGDITNAGSAYSFDLPLFADGFESSDTTKWSTSVP